ncbi:MAG: recombinase family protein [Chloroflexi bacterium]|nr:recombinase family protein [Chloroflexota bacterium]
MWERSQELIEAFADPARSGRNKQRPQLVRLRQAVCKNQVDVVVIDRADDLKMMQATEVE